MCSARRSPSRPAERSLPASVGAPAPARRPPKLSAAGLPACLPAAGRHADERTISPPPTRRAASTARLTRLLLSSDLLRVTGWSVLNYNSFPLLDVGLPEVREFINFGAPLWQVLPQKHESDPVTFPPRSDACRLSALPTKATPPAAAHAGRSQGCAEDFSAWPHSELEGRACHVTQPRGCQRRPFQRGDRRVREERSLGGGAVAAPRNGVDAQRESRRVLVLVRDLGTSQGAQRLASSPRAAARDAHARARTLALLLQRGDHGVRVRRRVAARAAAAVGHGGPPQPAWLTLTLTVCMTPTLTLTLTRTAPTRRPTCTRSTRRSRRAGVPASGARRSSCSRG